MVIRYDRGQPRPKVRDDIFRIHLMCGVVVDKLRTVEMANVRAHNYGLSKLTLPRILYHRRVIGDSMFGPRYLSVFR